MIEKRANPGQVMMTDGIWVICNEYYVSGTLSPNTTESSLFPLFEMISETDFRNTEWICVCCLCV